MKIKIDFVTNSSSSAFVVVFKKKVNELNDVLKYVSGVRKAKQVLKDSLKQTPIKISKNNKKALSKVVEELTYGYTFELDYYKHRKKFCERNAITEKQLHNNPAWRESWYKEYQHEKEKINVKKAVSFLSRHEGSYLYYFRYADEDGSFFSEMEHGGTFDNLPHITISHH